MNAAILGTTVAGLFGLVYLSARWHEGNAVMDRFILQEKVHREVSRTLTQVQAQAQAELHRLEQGPPHLVHIRGTEDWALEWAEHVVPDGRYGAVIYTPASTREERVVREVLDSRYLELRPRQARLAGLSAWEQAWTYRRDYVVRTIGSPKALPPA